MHKPVPSLSANGWLVELTERADALMAYYLTSEYSQSYIYHGAITSLTYHIQQHGQAPDRLEEHVHRDLSRYFRRYFDDVQLEVTTSIPDHEDPNRLNLTINAIIIEKGQRYSLGREVRTLNNRVVTVFNLNNQ
jgi:hypothetical protein